ncbi:LicD family protein [Thomasclavelia cocleata]|uniref:Lipopolysaccharide cholinephosphotransferase n=3 Tax=Thomasclavelia cocleata TaxID=69824 RepID=A0A1I0F856_9FIRM|nr:LicD family protein [Thomasclavelia cocleata]MCR1960612.1 LicD family protein [Thomasclavelia cocleata]SET54170.1 lipopolysaccharide cholinephosphotransferase [Thomasclavelia cocleata]
MKQISSQDIQSLELNILKAFKNFAQENNIIYYLCGGTLLGAIRHKGFIPWDDDIDICIPRNSYDKLIELVKEDRYIENTSYKFCLPLDDNYIYPYIKVVDTNTIVYEKDIKKEYCLGVWIDIFPLDEFPKTSPEIKKVVKKHSNYKFFNKIYVSGNLSTPLKKIIAFFAKIFYSIVCFNKDNKYWVTKILSLVKNYDSNYIGNLVWPNQYREIFDKSVYAETLEYQFGDEFFPIPAGYDEYLTNMYGNYMELPKPSERVFHDFEAYILDNDKN